MKINSISVRARNMLLTYNSSEVNGGEEKIYLGVGIKTNALSHNLEFTREEFRDFVSFVRRIGEDGGKVY